MTATQLRHEVRRLARASHPDFEIAQVVGRSTARVKKIRLAFGIFNRWRDKDDKRLLELADTGLSVTGIAKEIKRSRSSVHRRLQMLGEADRLQHQDKQRSWWSEVWGRDETVAVLAARFGKHPSTVRQVLAMGER